jgi:hypothetical protein
VWFPTADSPTVGRGDDDILRGHGALRRLEALPLHRPRDQDKAHQAGVSGQPADIVSRHRDGDVDAGSLLHCDIQRHVVGCDGWDRVVVTGGVEVTQHPRVLYLRDFMDLRDMGVEVRAVSELQPDYLRNEDKTWESSARDAFGSRDFFSTATAEFYVRTAARRTKQPPGGSRGWEVAQRPAGGAWASAFLGLGPKNPVDPVTALMFPHPIPGIVMEAMKRYGGGVCSWGIEPGRRV